MAAREELAVELKCGVDIELDRPVTEIKRHWAAGLQTEIEERAAVDGSVDHLEVTAGSVCLLDVGKLDSSTEAGFPVSSFGC